MLEEQRLETEPLLSPSGNDKYVPAMRPQSHDLQPPAGAHVNSARERLQFLCAIRSGQACCFSCQCQGGSTALVNAETTEVIKQAGLGLASEKEGARLLCTFSFLQCQHYRIGIGIYFPPNAI